VLPLDSDIREGRLENEMRARISYAFLDLFICLRREGKIAVIDLYRTLFGSGFLFWEEIWIVLSENAMLLPHPYSAQY